MKIGLTHLIEPAGAKPGDAASADGAVHAARPARTSQELHAPGGIRPGAVVAPGAARADHVTLSSAGSSASRLAAAAVDGDFDSSKVYAIQAAIRDGRFSVNASAIAERLIAEAAAMIIPRTQ